MDTMWPTFLKDGDAVRNTTTFLLNALSRNKDNTELVCVPLFMGSTFADIKHSLKTSCVQN